MSSFLNSISSVLVILLMTAAGYIFGARKWMVAEYKPFLEKYLMFLAIPCATVDGFLKNISPELLRGSWRILVISTSALIICSLLSFLLAYLLRLPRNRAGAFIGMGGFSNALFVGYPMCRELFGDESVPYVMLFFLCLSILIFIVCYAGFAWFSGTENKIGRDRIVKIFVNPPVISAIVGVLMVIFGLTFPRPLNSLLGYVSATVSPLALFYCGFVIYEFGIKNIRIDRGIAVASVMRFVAAPLICAALCRLLGVSAPASSVLVVEISMPVVTVLVVMAKEWDADVQYAAVGIVLTTLACFVVVPVLMLFI